MQSQIPLLPRSQPLYSVYIIIMKNMTKRFGTRLIPRWECSYSCIDLNSSMYRLRIGCGRT